jgi:hypothetical protein
MPAAEATPFEMIEAEFAFEILIHALGAPALFEQLNELYERHALVRRQVEVARLVVGITPLADEPHTLPAARFMTVIGCGDDAQERESSREGAGGTFTPGVATKRAVLDELRREVVCRARVAMPMATGIDDPRTRGRTHRDREVETELSATLPELRVAVALVGENGSSRNVRGNRAAQHPECELWLGLKGHVFGDPGLGAPGWIVGPTRRKVQLEIDWNVILRRRDREADTDLTIRDLTGGAGVLPLHADGMLPLLEEASVVDNPCPGNRGASQLLDRIAGGVQPHRVIVPCGVGDEVEESLVSSVHVFHARSGARDDRFHALAVAFTNQPQCIVGEILAPLRRTEDAPQVVEERMQSLRSGAVDLDVHELQEIMPRSRQQLQPNAAPQPIEMIQVGRSLRCCVALTQ